MSPPTIQDSDITLRLKHGIHTIFIFVDPDWKFSRLTEELLEILRDRFPEGLCTSVAPPQTTPIPEPGSDVKIAYAVPKTPSDLTQGWKNLKAKDNDRIASKKLGDVSALAFTLLDADADDDDVEFIVDVPVLDDVEYE